VGKTRRIVRAVTDVSFSIPRGETLALIGESGSGKSTIARCIAGVLDPTAGRITIMGQDRAKARTREETIRLRRNLQMIFQDPYASLNPRWRTFDSIAEPLRTHRLAVGRRAVEERVFEMVRLVGLSPEDGRKFPHQFSGGQRQRISIARALAAEPAFIIADEPTSALDVSVQAQILNLMRDLQAELVLTYLFISHNLAVVSNMANTIGVLYLGRLVEIGSAAHLLSRPRHPYTKVLVDAVPVERCTTDRPTLRALDGVQVACHRAEDMRAVSEDRAASVSSREAQH
jgi:peptide/nickel transport system ATP-binding protein